MKRFVNHLIRCTNSIWEVWLLFGLIIGVFAILFAWAEGITWFDAVYWACTTATSTGYGDISPKTAAGKLLAIGLMFIALFFILPLLIGHVIQILMPNRHEFTHQEQERILGTLDAIAAKLGISIEDLPADDLKI